ncbi:DnaJ family domain-containing protein [beta proteobacterium MWH-UniP1]
MSIFDVIAENKIQEAIQKGQLDQPALFGQPIHVDDDFSISAESRFLIRRMRAITGSRPEPSPLAARWKAMQYQKYKMSPNSLLKK